MTLTVGSLFSGIGGIDLGLERAGMTVRWQSEIDPYCARVLEKHWPDVPNFGDVTQIDWETVERVDLICGGYPCQPFSLAGARRGTDDARHLWPHFRDALGVLRPRYALLENVPGHLSLGFGDVLSDLAGLGYDTEWDCLPAAAVGAPHLRYRLFVVAHARYAERWATSPRGSDVQRERSDGIQGRQEVSGSSCRSGEAFDPDADGGGQQERTQLDRQPQSDTADGDSCGRHADRLRDPLADTDEERRGRRAGQLGTRRWRQPEDCGWWTVEPDICRVAHGVPRRVDRLRALGNAVVPQVAEYIGRRILEAAA